MYLGKTWSFRVRNKSNLYLNPHHQFHYTYVITECAAAIFCFPLKFNVLKSQSKTTYGTCLHIWLRLTIAGAVSTSSRIHFQLCCKAKGNHTFIRPKLEFERITKSLRSATAGPCSELRIHNNQFLFCWSWRLIMTFGWVVYRCWRRTKDTNCEKWEVWDNGVIAPKSRLAECFGSCSPL